MAVRETRQTDTADAWASGGIIFAACMLILIGTLEALEGLAAIAKDQFFVVSSNYAYKIDVSTWGWIHLILGIVVVLAGFYVLRGSTWARVIAIAVAGVSAIANFLYIPYYPFWSLLIIALNAFVIWALTTRGGSLRTR
jgi:hypothetical protein